MVETKEVFTYPLTTYLIVLGVASLAGIVRYINSDGSFKWKFLLRDCLTSGFNGLVVFWYCDYKQVTGSLLMVFVAVGAMMGSRAWVEVEKYLRVRFGTANQSDDSSQQTLGRDGDQAANDSLVNKPGDLEEVNK